MEKNIFPKMGFRDTLGKGVRKSIVKGRGPDIYKIIISVLVCQAAGFIGYIFTRPAIPTWYAELLKPRFTPPDWVFGPVWVSLYILMGIAAFLVWRRGLHHQVVRRALAFFGVHLALNALWSFLFFGLRSPLAGLI